MARRDQTRASGPTAEAQTGQRKRSGLSAARAYHPRGQTLRERPVGERAARKGAGDQFRPALKLLQEDDEAVSQTRASAGRAGSRRGAEAKSRAGESRAGKSGAGDSRVSTSGKRPAGATAPKKQQASSQSARKSTGKARGKPPGAGGPPRGPAVPRRPPKLAEPRRRLRLATVLALTMFAALGIRLVELQVTDGPAFAASGLANRLQDVVLPAPRGAIYDRHDAVLAHSVEARFVFADPELVNDPERNAVELQPLLGVPASELAAKMAPRTREDGEQSRFEWLARGVDLDTAQAIEELNLRGIGTDRDERRHVPGNDLAANLIGFTGEDLAGLVGLESELDDVLRGVNGSRTFETGLGESLNREIPGGFNSETPAEPGSHVRLTIDADLQYEVQRMLAELTRPIGSSFSNAVVLDARTSEVLAQASYPGFNAADPSSATELEWIDTASRTVFDPGSAHKPIVFGAALQEGLLTPDQTVTVDPTVRKGDTTFRDTIWHPPGTKLSLPEVMAYSSNVGTIKIADMIGKDTLYTYQQAFGLGATTGVGMPGEAEGGLLAPQDWSGSSYGSVPIGHSVDITTLQLAMAYSVIANDGTWTRPSLVQSVIAPDGTEDRAGGSETREVLSPQTAAHLREIMEAVVSVPGATGINAAIDGYRVAGKTGTGKLVVEGDYAAGDVSSFVGMAPAEDPQYVIAVVTHAPDGGGGEVVTTAFREMMGFAFKHYRVPPSDADPPTFDE